MRTMVRLCAALDRAPRPYTAGELSEITDVPLKTVMAFLRKNETRCKVSSRRINRVPQTVGGRMIKEYWRGQSGVTDTFGVDNMMDGNTEDRLRTGKRPVTWRDGNYTNWSIDEADTVATMRGGEVVRLGKLDGVSYSKQGVTLRVTNSMKITFRREL
jgi:hypothetical protein